PAAVAACARLSRASGAGEAARAIEALARGKIPESDHAWVEVARAASAAGAAAVRTLAFAALGAVLHSRSGAFGDFLEACVAHLLEGEDALAAIAKRDPRTGEAVVASWSKAAGTPVEHAWGRLVHAAGDAAGPPLVVLLAGADAKSASRVESALS